MKTRKRNMLLTSLLIAIALTSCESSTGSSTEPLPRQIALEAANFHPEGIVYSDENDVFFVGSYHQGKIIQLDLQGQQTLFAEEAGFVSIVGLAIDATNQRLAAVNSDLGLSQKSSQATTGSLAELYIYDLSDGLLLHRVDLSAIVAGGHFVNDVIADERGNFYVTDSFTPAIYKVNAAGQAELLLIDATFAPNPGGIGLNGIVYHPDGYLIAAKTDGARLFKIPLDNPANFSEVALNRSVNAIDGLLLQDNQTLALVSNNFTGAPYDEAVYQISSSDAWSSARVEKAYTELQGEFPTTVTQIGQTPYVVFGHFQALASGSSVSTFNVQRINF